VISQHEVKEAMMSNSDGLSIGRRMGDMHSGIFTKTGTGSANADLAFVPDAMPANLNQDSFECTDSAHANSKHYSDEVSGYNGRVGTSELVRLSDLTSPSAHSHFQEMACSFSDANGPVIVSGAPIKGVVRMREKLSEYAADGAEWPLTACILDPIRASVICNGPRQMLEVCGWFTSKESGMPVCRIKNKFALDKAALVVDPILPAQAAAVMSFHR
jgi:hypothetical protein